MIFTRSVSLLIKPISSICNMSCYYCFYNDISRKREITSYGKMTEKTLENLVIKSLNSADYFCNFAFQGGEPTLAGLEFYKKFVDIVGRYKNQVQTNFSIQTNGLNINEEWVKFFKDNNFLVGLSLDGTKETHDLFRKDKQGKGTFNRVMKTVDLFNKYNIDYNILTVVSSQLARHPQKVYDYYKEKGFQFLQFIPVIEPYKDEKKHFYSLTQKKYAFFLKVLFDNWYNDFLNGKYISIRLFDNWIRIIAGYNPEACEMQGICSIQNVIEADGSIYPCDFYVLDEYNIGNINKINNLEEVINNKISKDFINSSLKTLDDCHNCEWFNLCRNGCKRYRYKEEKYYFCEAYKEFFEYSFIRMKEVADYLKENHLRRQSYE